MRSIVVAGLLASFLQSSAPALRIVVLEGEDAVNVIQQKTAVRPLVEVRDRNNVPVAGATVTFSIGGGQPAAFAGGVHTITVTTNAAGQAAAGGFNAVGSGAVQIQVQAAYQGQIATAAISQTNVATAAAASQAGAAASGAGGGVSGTTIGIVGAAVAGGAVAATQVGGNNNEPPAVTATTPPPVPPPVTDTTFTGAFNGQIVVTTTSGSSTCVSTRSVSGTLRITLRNGNASGTLQTTGTVQEVALTASSLCSPLGTSPFNYGGDITGGPSNLTFAFEGSNTSTGIATVTATETVKFIGSLAGDAITGTLGYAHRTRGTGNGGNAIAGDGSTVMAVTLR